MIRSTGGLSLLVLLLLSFGVDFGQGKTLTPELNEALIDQNVLLSYSHNNFCFNLPSNPLPISRIYLSYTNYFLQPNQTIQSIDKFMALMLALSNLAPRNCRSSSTLLAAMTGLPACLNVTLTDSKGGSYTVNLPRPTCSTICTNTATDCAGVVMDVVYQTIPYLTQGCETTMGDLFPFPNALRYYPEKGWNMTVVDNGTRVSTVFLPCYDGHEENSTYFPSDFVPCIPPLARDPNPSPDKPLCAVECPDPSFSEEEYKSVKIMLGITGWMSWATTLFISLSYLMDPSRRKFPKNLPMMSCFSSHIISIGVVISSMAGFNKVWCDNSPVGLDSHNGSCVFQGLLIMYGALSGMFWWLCIAAHLFIAIVLKKQHDIDMNKLSIGMLAFSWGLPVPLVIIALAARKISYFPTATICFINSDDNSWWQYTLFYIPILLCVLLGVPMLLSIFYRIWQVARESNTFPKSTQMRIGCFLVLFTYTWIFLAAFRFYVTRKEGDFVAAFQRFLLCTITRQPNCQLAERMKYDYWMLYAFTVGAQGIFCVVSFGTEINVYAPWIKLVNTKFVTATSTDASWRELGAPGKRNDVLSS